MFILNCKHHCKNGLAIIEKAILNDKVTKSHDRNLHAIICSMFNQLLCLSACQQSSVIAKTVIFYNLTIYSIIANVAALVLTWKQFELC